MAETDNLYTPRSFGTRNLSTGIPKPNIVRIEVLDGNARQRYLGTLQIKGDKLKQNLYDKIAGRGDSVFFGFMRHVSDQTFGIDATWTTTGGSGNILTGMKKMVAGATGGIITEGEMDTVSNMMRSLTGLSAQSTGSSSLQQFSDIKLSNFSIDCGWYLPEQFNLCAKSLKVLTRMIYPRQVDEKKFAEMVGPIVVDQVKQGAQIIKETGKSALIMGKALIGLDEGPSQEKPASPEVNTNVTTHVNQEITKTVAKAVNVGAEAFNKFNDFFGRNLTFDPLPVRLTIGQYVDIEPLVIDNIKIGFSKETFVSDSGRHIPITCNVSIQFQFWLKPAPKLEFMALLGQEMFGTESTTNITNNTEKKV
jgi:hypothetical protein